MAAVEHGLLPAISLSGARHRMELAERMAHYHVPAIAVAIIDDGVVCDEAAWGLADPATARAATTGSLFQAACLSKIATTVVALRLVARGILSLDRPVNEFLQSWQVPENEFTRAEPVTLRHLLSHAASTTVDGYGNGFARYMTPPTLVQLLDGKSPAACSPVRVTGPVGRGFRYSSGGFAIVQLAVEETTGRGFAEVARELVLEPAGMHSSTFERPLPGHLTECAATGHLIDGQPLADGWRVVPELASSGLWTTAGDFARLLVAIGAAVNASRGALLPRDLAAEMFRSQYGAPATLGAFVLGEGDRERILHDGSNTGYRSEALLFTDGRRGAVTLTNGESGDRLSKEVLNSIADSFGWDGYVVERRVIDLAPEILRRYVGYYEIMPGVGFVIEPAPGGEGLIVDALGFGRGRLFAESETVLFEPEIPTEFRFHMSGEGVPDSALVSFRGRSFAAKRVP